MEKKTGDFVRCGDCGGSIKYNLLADAIFTRRCPKGCGAGIIITRPALNTAIKNIDKRLKINAKGGKQ